MIRTDYFSRLWPRGSGYVVFQNPVALIAEVIAKQSRLAQSPLLALSDQYAILREKAHSPRVNHLDLATSAFALVAEALIRTSGITLYPCQIHAGLALVAGKVAEMQTGEGKTLAAALPATYHALFDRGVHIATANAYLAARDCELLRPVFEILGLKCEFLAERATAEKKRFAYDADITYASGYELGFDYLRDQLTQRNAHSSHELGDRFKRLWITRCDNASRSTLQRGLAAVIIDEIDNVLLDEATTPLLLSLPGPTTAPDSDLYLLARKTIASFHLSQHFSMDATSGDCVLTPSGWEEAYQQPIPLDRLQRPWSSYIEQTLQANYFFKRDIHYVVVGDEVHLVDEHTGRIFSDRTWRHGLHQAIQAKEGLTIFAEPIAAGIITRQTFFGLYRSRCGLTGTATDSEAEFRHVYRMPVTRIATHRPCLRTILPTLGFPTKRAKWQTLSRDAATRQQKNQPVLIGTKTIADSLEIAEQLSADNVCFQLLNGRQDADEASIIARAGEAGMVTIATNMAGRGTDICPTKVAIASGGLHVIVADTPESRRVERQLMGRSARQGNPGTSQRYACAEDAVLQTYAPQLGEWLRRHSRQSLSVPAGWDRAIHRLQQHIEQTKAQSRFALWDADRKQFRPDHASGLPHSLTILGTR